MKCAPSIEVAGLTHRFGAGPLLFDNLSFEIDATADGRGQIVALMGPSGVGKSTILQLVAQWEDRISSQISGSITIRNANTVSYIPQEPVLIESRGFSYNVDLFSQIASLKSHWSYERREKFIELLKIDSLRSRTEMKNLSGGEKQRVMLARTLSVNPDVLLLDEPASSLDQSVKIPLLTELRDLIVSNGILAIYITHEFNEARLVADKILYLERGHDNQAVGGRAIAQPIEKFAEKPPTINAAYTVFAPYFGVAASKTNNGDLFSLAFDGSQVAFEGDGLHTMVRSISSSTVLLSVVDSPGSAPLPIKRALFGPQVKVGDVVHVGLNVGTLRYDEHGSIRDLW